MGLAVRSLRPETQYRSEPWYGAYMSALFESDPALIASRIRLAEQFILSRERELYNSRAELQRSTCAAGSGDLSKIGAILNSVPSACYE